ncbi:hypothetical protein GGR50DRAFT_686792 [Xylaria sp. CBS 124048]|nr:hypothetical protein GGR50DRAFT_686792 [Xylaria sp. CBS 124048]
MESAQPKGDGLKVIHASLYRMGTRSMAEAYTILGYNVHHALLGGWNDNKWKMIEEAAEATWPSVSTTPRPPFTREDWDTIWGSEFDIVTDLACAYVPELIKAYPEAKVIIVQRDFDAWWTSFSTNIRDRLFRPRTTVMTIITTTFLGFASGTAMKKTLRGFFGAKTKREMSKERCREVYDDYFRQIREMVPPERRLEYTVGDGWEPLCSFLGKEVPKNVPFPQKNDGAQLRSSVNSAHLQSLKQSLGVIGRSAVTRALVGGVGGWLVYRRLLK